MSTVHVNYLGCGYEVQYQWNNCDFELISIYPPIKHPVLHNHIKTKAVDKAIEEEYDAWIKDHELDSLDETEDLGWTLLGKHNIYSGGGLDNH